MSLLPRSATPLSRRRVLRPACAPLRLPALVLKALSWGPLHGYAINEWIEGASESVLLLEEGTLYPALHRLERAGWIGFDLGSAENNRQVKIYKLTRLGRSRLNEEKENWNRVTTAVARILEAN